MSRGRLLATAAVLVAALALVSCSQGDHGKASTPPSSAAHRDVLVSIGSNAAFGDGLDDRLRDAWPQLLYRDAFPASTVFVNASDRFVTVGRSLGQPLSVALEVHATVVVIWIGDLDLDAGVEASLFEADLDRLVAPLRDAGARVLLGNLPRTQPGAAAYNDAIARIATARGATVVDVATALAADPGTRPSSDVTPLTSRTIADAFAAALRS